MPKTSKSSKRSSRGSAKERQVEEEQNVNAEGVDDELTDNRNGDVESGGEGGGEERGRPAKAKARKSRPRKSAASKERESVECPVCNEKLTWSPNAIVHHLANAYMTFDDAHPDEETLNQMMENNNTDARRFIIDQAVKRRSIAEQQTKERVVFSSRLTLPESGSASSAAAAFKIDSSKHTGGNITIKVTSNALSLAARSYEDSAKELEATVKRFCVSSSTSTTNYQQLAPKDIRSPNYSLEPDDDAEAIRPPGTSTSSKDAPLGPDIEEEIDIPQAPTDTEQPRSSSPPSLAPGFVAVRGNWEKIEGDVSEMKKRQGEMEEKINGRLDKVLILLENHFPSGGAGLPDQSADDSGIAVSSPSGEDGHAQPTFTDDQLNTIFQSVTGTWGKARRRTAPFPDRIIPDSQGDAESASADPENDAAATSPSTATPGASRSRKRLPGPPLHSTPNKRPKTRSTTALASANPSLGPRSTPVVAPVPRRSGRIRRQRILL